MTHEEFIKNFQKRSFEIVPNSNTNNILVTVCVQAYEHENHIKQCLNSILMQKTNFNFEISLGEDDSKDNTREICIEYAKRFPEKIKLFLHSRANNIVINSSPTGRFNFMTNVFSSKAKYIAFCEGDDYWTDPYKLQKQVDFLEQNTGFVLCSGNAVKLEHKSNKNVGKYCHWNENKVFKQKDVISNYYGPALTMLFRNVITEFPDFFFEVIGADRMLYFILSTRGKFYFFKDTFGVYRIHDGGISSVNSKNSEVRLKWEENSLKGIEHFKNIALTEQQWALDKHIVSVKLTIISSLMKCNRKLDAFKQWIKLPFKRGLYSVNNIRTFFKSFFRFFR